MSVAKKNFFSDSPAVELTARWLCLILSLIILLALILFWEPLRSLEFVAAMVSFTYGAPALEYFFRAVTFLGDEEFFLVFLPIIYWCINKPLGFWGSMILILSTFITSEIPKDITRLPRPAIEGVNQSPTYTFPSGHTSGAVSVWGYMAVQLRKRWFWIWALTAMTLVGLSRIMLGFHFVGDVLGGIVAGLIFLVLFIKAGEYFTEQEWDKKPFAFILLIALAVPLAMSLLPVTYADRLMGYVAGGGLGYALENRFLSFTTQGRWYSHIIKSVLGIAVLFVIVIEVGRLLPAGHIFVFFHYTLAGFWVTFLAPLLFIKLRLLFPSTISME